MCLVLWRMESKVQGQSRYVNYPFPLEGRNKVLPDPSFFSLFALVQCLQLSCHHPLYFSPESVKLFNCQKPKTNLKYPEDPLPHLSEHSASSY